jgi:hypothetical protein
VPVVLDVAAVVELDDVAEAEAVVVVAKTQGVAMRAVATTMPAIAASCAVLVFILSSTATSALRIYQISEMTPESLQILSEKHPELRKQGPLRREPQVENGDCGGSGLGGGFARPFTWQTTQAGRWREVEKRDK